MKTKTRWVVPFLSLIAMNVASAAPLNRTQMQAIKTIYARQDTALLTKNIEALIAQTDVNFQRKTTDGQIREGRALEREYMKAGFAQVKSFNSVRTALTRTDFIQNKIIVIAQVKFIGTFRNLQGKWGRESLTSTSRDTWISTRNGWRIRMTEELR